jgi:hypothetical protein
MTVVRLDPEDETICAVQAHFDTHGVGEAHDLLLKIAGAPQGART